jgi:chemotaxis protein MotB
MARRRRHEEHENHEAWAIPYGDLVTLLLAFFVVMYAMSSVNEGKYRVLSDSLSEAFHGPPHTSQTIEAGGPRPPPAEQLPLTQVNRLITAALPMHRVVPPPVAAAAGTATPPAAAPAAPPAAPSAAAPAAAVAANPGAVANRAGGNAANGGELNQVADDVSEAMAGMIASGQVHVHRYDSWVAVDISTDILFDSGSARLSRPAVSALQRLADSLKGWPNAVRVEGHTDNRPIATAAFPSNWELSAARAAGVVHLFMDRGVAPERLAVIGFGEYRPSMPNSTADGRNANRRVEVIILGRDGTPEGHL